MNNDTPEHLTPPHKYGISLLPKEALRPAEGYKYAFCEQCGHNAHLHNRIGTWECRYCDDCPEYESEFLRDHIAKKSKSKIFGRTIPGPIKRAVIDRDGMVCHYCFHRLHTRRSGPHKLHLDHRTPFSRGGKNTVDNLVPSCLDCNLAKHDMAEDEFWEARKMFRMGCHRKPRMGTQIVAQDSRFDPYPSVPGPPRIA